MQERAKEDEKNVYIIRRASDQSLPKRSHPCVVSVGGGNANITQIAPRHIFPDFPREPDNMQTGPRESRQTLKGKEKKIIAHENKIQFETAAGKHT